MPISNVVLGWPLPGCQQPVRGSRPRQHRAALCCLRCRIGRAAGAYVRKAWRRALAPSPWRLQAGREEQQPLAAQQARVALPAAAAGGRWVPELWEDAGGCSLLGHRANRRDKSQSPANSSPPGAGDTKRTRRYLARGDGGGGGGSRSPVLARSCLPAPRTKGCAAKALAATKSPVGTRGLGAAELPPESRRAGTGTPLL